jgi:hypothetical protein
MKRKTPLGIGLMELMITITLFSIVGLISFIILNRGISSWRTLMETQTAELQLSKAAARLESDLTLSQAGQVQTSRVPSSLAGASDGTAIWFLSAVDPNTGIVVRKPDGSPFWQRNILFYVVVPDQHQSLFGYDCAGGIGPDGFEDRCPHKVLLRKVIDSGVATNSTTDPTSTEEVLLPDVTEYLTRPMGYDVRSMSGERGLQETTIAANRLLWFEAKIGAEPDWPQEVTLDIRATAIKDAERETAVGTVSLFDSVHTTTRLRTLTPEN